jgi:integrase/recombinase XerD
MGRQKQSATEKHGTKQGDCVASTGKAKSQIIAQIVRIARKERLDYAGFIYVCQQVRRKLGLLKPKKERKLPQLLAETELKRFFSVIHRCGNLQHEIMLKLLFFTAVRVSELVNIKVEDIDFDQCRIVVSEGEGRKDRYILFPMSFRLVLQSHLRANPKNRHLFETARSTRFTPRRIQQIVKQYRDEAGIAQHVHPHLFRHQMITYLTARGLSASQIQLISGRESEKSLKSINISH